MARAARDSCRQAARLGLLVALLTACAVLQEPPGGPPDFAPPVVVSLTPDSGTVVAGLEDPLVIRFDEVISEQSGGGLDRLVLLSPRVEQVKVSWKRTAIEIEPKGNWQPGVVYHVTLLPGIRDLQNNQLTEGRTIIFSTGGSIPDTHLRGTVLDWENGRAARGALVEAVLLPDSLVYLAQTDSVGEFDLSAIPRGRYLAFASIDANNDRQRGSREAFDSMSIALDSSATTIFWTFVQDTVGAQIRQLTRVDSITFRIDFNKKLAPGTPEPGAVLVWALPDTTPVPVGTIWTEVTYDSVRAAEAAAAAAEAAAGAALDTTGAGRVAQAGADTVAGAAATVGGGRVQQQRRVAQPVDTTAAADTSRIAQLLAQRPALSAAWLVRVAQSLVPGTRYLVEARAQNVSGAVAPSRSVLVLPAPRDST